MDDPVKLAPFTKIIFSWIEKPPLLGVLLLMQAIDIVCGFLVAYRSKTISSSITFEGIRKKIGVWILVMVLAVLNKAIPDIPGARIAAIGFVLWETLSITEKLAMMGVWIPPGVVEALAKVREFRNQYKTQQPQVIHKEVEKYFFTAEPPPASNNKQNGNVTVTSKDIAHNGDITDHAPKEPKP